MKQKTAPLLLSLAFAISSSSLSIASNDSMPTASAGSIERLENFESEYVASRNVDIWFPEGYDGTERFPVLYMHDGQMLFDSTRSWNGQEWGIDEVFTSLIDAGQIDPCIVVGVWNAGDGRHGDYFPQKPFESLPIETQFKLVGGEQGHFRVNGLNADGYLKFLVTELKPYIDSNYATLPEKETTFVAGSSMGGLISMYAICEYPSVFSKAACISTHWIGAHFMKNNPIPDAFVAYLKASLPDPESHSIYFDHGTVGLDAEYGRTQVRVDEVMQSAGYNRSNWTTIVFEGADHTENDWQARMDKIAEFLLGR